MRGLRKGLSLLTAVILGGACLPAQTTGLQTRNNFSARILNHSLEDGRGSEIRLGWKPALFAEYFPVSNVRISAEVETDAWARGVFEAGADRQTMDLGLYRAWGAASVDQTELKAGLQHIRMGTARIFRPLMWFDRLQPEALLNETPGVTALTLAHFFPNPELRLWLMPAAGKLKGAETLPSQPDSWETGGRMGFSSSWGDTGLSYHRRQIDPHTLSDAVCEQRLGLDHRVDGVLGAWLEGSVELRDRDIDLPQAKLARQSLAVTLGEDYTLGIGNGLYLMAEQNLKLPDLLEVDTDEAALAGALLLSYPLGLLDELRCLANWDFAAQRGSGTLAWRQVYDLLSWELSLGLDSGFPKPASRSPRLALAVNYDL